jgi:hypothetical protein
MICDPREEAYTEACEEIDRLRAQLYAQLEDVALGIARKNAEIERLKFLLIRAADALEAWSDKRHPLVQELRKEAEINL